MFVQKIDDATLRIWSIFCILIVISLFVMCSQPIHAEWVQVIDGIVNRLGDLENAYLIDDYAEGKDSGIIDLLLVGEIDPYHLNDLSRKTERYINRKIRSLVVSREEFDRLGAKFKQKPRVLIWESRKE